MTSTETEEKIIKEEHKEEKKKPVEIYAEKAEDTAPELDGAQIRAAALAYARYLKENGLAPGDATFVEPEELEVDLEEKKEEGPGGEKGAADGGEKADGKKDPAGKKGKKGGKKGAGKKENRKARERRKSKEKLQKEFLRERKHPLAAVTNLHDKLQDGADRVVGNMGKDAVKGVHRMADGYRGSRRTIGMAILLTGILVAAILIIFDSFTVYEYAYNGKVLGYVKEQEEVTDVLGIAGKKLSINNGGIGVEFVANQNVTFRRVDGRGKSKDDADTAVNKLIYMTDIETEAYAVYDGNKVVAIVKDSNDADELLRQTKAELSTPDRGMELVSAEFINDLSTRPVNVLLGSVQSNAVAQRQMIKGGEMHTYHIVEEGETAEDLALKFGVEAIDIYNEDNSDVATDIEQGDRVCIRTIVEPVSVKMVEKGKIKEVIEFSTIKKETDEYYKGDTYLQQEGHDGMQIFEGTITKISGVEVSRKETAPPKILEKHQDKIILVGTAERPKTAATGTFKMPIEHYVITSEFGGRWGRVHEGMDFGAGTGTPIYAADGGRVIKANFWSGHGLCVEIDHGNGVITRYSHCSAVHVSVGDLVYQGQHIANVGNTGHSFGSHLHFEVRVNGTAQNPRNYIHP